MPGPTPDGWEIHVNVAPNRCETHEANRRAAWRWGSLIVGLLGLQVLGGIMAIVLANGDDSVAVVPDYHQKALHWDDEVALQAASRALQWNCQVSQIAEPAGRNGLQIMLADRLGKPIDVLAGELQIYRHARAGDVRRLPLPPGMLGRLELADCFGWDGLWQVTLDVRDRSQNRFVHSSELVVTGTQSLPIRSPQALGAKAPGEQAP